MSDLRKLDEEIARMRGWDCSRLGWMRPMRETDAICDWWSAFTGGAVPLWDEQDPPPFSRGGALTWALFEEWIGDNELDDLCGEMYRRGDSTPGEVVARAWAEWRRGRAC